MPSKVFSLSPSQQWAGNDGNWSTFAVRVGSNADTLMVLPATSGRSTWLVHPRGCESPGDPTNCDDRRGGVFAGSDNSSTWRNVTNSGEYYQLNFGPEQALTPQLPEGLNYVSASIPGTDDIAFGFNGDTNAPELKDQFLALYPAKVPYIGVLGLSDVNESITGYSDTHYSVLGAWNSSGQVDRAFWGYTAGAHYREEEGNLASLTFGGYDASRGNLKDVLTVPMAEGNENRTLVVTVHGVTLTDNAGTQPVELPPFRALVDSVVPEIWLPEAGYKAFEDTYGLVYNETVGLYLVDDEQHAQLSARNMSVTFSLAKDQSSPGTTSVTLPYAALQPFAGFPLLRGLTNDTTTSLRYFPLRRAAEEDQYYLGRTFLQEAYLAVDYETRMLHISPATFEVPAKLKAPGHDSGGLSGGAIAGIVIGALAALVILGGLVWFFCFRGKRDKKRRKSYDTPSSFGGTTIEAWQEDIPPGHAEHFKPAMSEIGSNDQDQFKQELDATTTARGASPFHRHELSAGTIRRASDQSRASISPLEERNRRSHYRWGSYGVPSPRSGVQMGAPSPPLPDSKHPSPPLSGSTSWFGGPVHELHGFSRGSPASPSTPAAVEEAPAVLGGSPTADRSTLNRLEGANA